MRNERFTHLGRHLVLAAAFGLVLTGPGAARAADNPRLNVDSFRPSVHAGDILQVLTGFTPGHLKVDGGLFFTWNNKPLTLVDPSGNKRFSPVTNQFVADLYFALGLSKYFSIGLDVPVFLQTTGDNPDVGSTLSSAKGISIGDIRLSLKSSFLGGHLKGWGVGLAADLTFPSATPRNFNGDRLVTFTPTLYADWAGRHGWNIALNIGLRYRPSVTIPDVPGGYDVGSEFLMAAGLVVPFICGKFEAIGTMEARTALSKPFQKEFSNSLDFLGGLRAHLSGVLFQAAAGGGALHGYGSPAYRVVLSVGYEPMQLENKGCVGDRDKDGICDADDRCPDVPGPKETQGCPDRDGDGLVDIDDRCPDQAGPIALKGCPDRDKDDIPDVDDRCPDEPGLERFQGCPDTDGDGIPDPDDACPKQPGPRELNGCPDRDGDGIPDKDDKCPDVFGKKEFDGCPPPTPKTVRLTENKIEILEVVLFDTGKSTIKKESFQLLQDVSTVLKDNPNIRKIRVEGHTDNVGAKAFNMKLSKDRAASVMDFLIKQGGVAADRLVSEGYGDTMPVDDNKTKEGKARNRRVEFVILEK